VSANNLHGLACQQASPLATSCKFRAPKKYSVLYSSKLPPLASPCRFRDFYQCLQDSLAILPSIASNRYYNRKSTSTVMSSIVSNTPLLISVQFQQVYSFFNASNAFIHNDSEQLHVALLQVLNMGVEEALNVRSSLLALQLGLNKVAVQHISEWLGHSATI